MPGTPTEKANDVTSREIDMAAEARKAWGPEWGKPEEAYVMSNGRKFYLRTEDAAIYLPQS